MREPIYLVKSHAGLKVYSGGEHIGTVPHDRVPYLTITCAEQLANRPERWEEQPAPPGLKRLIQQALLEEIAAHAPNRTTAIEALTQALEALKGEES